MSFPLVQIKKKPNKKTKNPTKHIFAQWSLVQIRPPDGLSTSPCACFDFHAAVGTVVGQELNGIVVTFLPDSVQRGSKHGDLMLLTWRSLQYFWVNVMILSTSGISCVILVN